MSSVVIQIRYNVAVIVKENPNRRDCISLFSRSSLYSILVMGLPRFTRPKARDSGSSPNLYVANCGPAVGHTIDAITSAFSSYGTVKGVYPADESGTRVIVSFLHTPSAQAAFQALDGRPCLQLGGRTLHIKFSVFQPPTQVLHTNRESTDFDPLQVWFEKSAH